MAKKAKGKLIGGRAVPIPTYWDKENQTAKFQTWLADYRRRAEDKNEIAKVRRKKSGTESA